jgi:hypothetical protein
LWCSEICWKRILQHNDLINNLVNGVNNESEWLVKIKNIIINKPESPLTRPGLNPKMRKISNSHFAIEESESEEES